MAKQTFTTGQVLTAAQMTSLQQTAMGGGSATAKTASYVLVAADAGGTVAMNAAGSTTITVNTGLFAAGDTVFIQNLGVGACTVTAGTATVSTAGSLILPQYDAGILYFTATGTSIFYDYIQTGAASPLTTKGDLYTFSTSDARLAVGTNTHVLTADSAEATGLKWAAAGGGGMTQLASGTLSGAAVTISSISGDYKDLMVVFAGITQSGNSSAYIKLNNAANVGSSNIYSSSLGNGSTGSYLWIAANSSYLMDSSAAENSFTYTITNYAGTTRKAVFGSGGYRYTGDADVRGFIIYGDCSATAAITRLDFVTSSGTFSGGSYIVYGVK